MKEKKALKNSECVFLIQSIAIEFILINGLIFTFGHLNRVRKHAIALIRCGFLLPQTDEDLFNDDVSCIPSNIINLSI